MPTPTCPSCGYDLSGLLQPEGSCTCPECNEHTTHIHATERISRWKMLFIAALLLLVVPCSMTGAAWAVLVGSNWSIGAGGSIALLLLAAQFVSVPLLAMLFIVRESALHTETNSTRHIRPGARLYFFFILIFAGISMTICLLVLYTLLDAVASI